MTNVVKDIIEKMDLDEFASVNPESSVRDALLAIEQKQVGCVLVVENREIVGIFSERDYARSVVTHQRGLDLNTPIHQVMKRDIVYVTPTYTLEECLAVMSAMRIRNLPVLIGKVPIALLSMQNIVEALVKEKNYMIGELTKYISGSYQLSGDDAHLGILGPVPILSMRYADQGHKSIVKFY